MTVRAEPGWFQRVVLDLGQQMRWSFLPPLMIYFSAGVSGLPALRDAVASSVSGRYHVPVDAEQVFIVPGGKVTIFFACMVFGGAGTEILYPDPGFPPYREAIKAASARPVRRSGGRRQT